MNSAVRNIFDRLFDRYSSLDVCKESIEKAYEYACETYRNGGKILVCGNGGSAADSEHIVGELMKGFMKNRELTSEEKSLFSDNLGDTLQGALPAISLVSQSGIITAYANDIDADMIFAQQVYGYGNKNDLLIGLSTSGNSRNVINAFKIAKGMGLNSWALVGRDGGDLAKIATTATVVPSNSTPDIQELHLPIYHTFCAMVEEEFFGDRR